MDIVRHGPSKPGYKSLGKCLQSHQFVSGLTETHKRNTWIGITKQASETKYGKICFLQILCPCSVEIMMFSVSDGTLRVGI